MNPSISARHPAPLPGIGVRVLARRGQPVSERQRPVCADGEVGTGVGTSFRPFRCHDLRHSFAVRALQNGLDICALSKHLGHSSVKTTEIYLGYVPNRDGTKAGTGITVCQQSQLPTTATATGQGIKFLVKTLRWRRGWDPTEVTSESLGGLGFPHFCSTNVWY
nr:site-specific integrase [Azospirillum ramasamyi]